MYKIVLSEIKVSKVDTKRPCLSNVVWFHSTLYKLKEDKVLNYKDLKLDWNIFAVLTSSWSNVDFLCFLWGSPGFEYR